MAAVASVLFMMLIAIGFVPSPAASASAATSSSVGAKAATAANPTFVHTLGLHRNNSPAVVKVMQQRVNVLLRRWGWTHELLPAQAGRGVYGVKNIAAISWVRNQINRHSKSRPILFSSPNNPLLGKYGFDIITWYAAMAPGTPVKPPVTPVPPKPVPPVRPTPVSGKPVVPAVGSLLGMEIAPRTSDWSEATQKRLWAARESAAGRTYDISHNFYTFTAPFPTWRETWAISQGRIPMVSWNGTTTGAILDGTNDAMIRQRAVALRDLHTPVFLRFYWEMDGGKKAAWAKSPADFIAAWRHVHQIFDAAGASNVAWVWCPNAWAWDVSLANATKWYPGDDVVDWICSDGYNWSPVRPGDKWRSFDTIYRNFYNWASAKNKPLMVGEVAALEDSTPGHKAQWIADTAKTLKTTYPKVKALVWFDNLKAEDNTHYDWRLDSSASSYAAWNTLARDPYFNKR